MKVERDLSHPWEAPEQEASSPDRQGVHAPLHPVIQAVTGRLRERSKGSRRAYLARIRQVHMGRPRRSSLACCNLAHGFAANAPEEKAWLTAEVRPNLAIVSAYNDMLSAHQPFEHFPAVIKQAARDAGGMAQFAGGVPAMCDGVTQGQVGMELSLFSRDVIAMSTAIALSHDMFDAAVLLGVCDKIVPGLVIGALSCGHLPVVLIPAGPMPSGLPNKEKSRTRQKFADGKIGRDELLAAEAASYHSPGTCTFYGTANSNQMLMEIMGLHLPGASFVPPNTPLREALTKAATARALALVGFEATEAGTLAPAPSYLPIGELLDERSFVNGVVGLLATGGSTNHTLHLVAMAAAAGIHLTWQDFSDLSAVIPQLTRIYPNGSADINEFHAAGGMAFLIHELLEAGLLHPDVQTVAGPGLHRYTQVPRWVVTEDATQPSLVWQPLATEQGHAVSGDLTVLRGAAEPFAVDGGLRILTGNLGRAVIKASAVRPEHRVIEAPAKVFHSQEGLLDAFRRGELECDLVAVLRFQGPRANGMPELHQLTPTLGNLLDRGHRVALVTDGRMSGASGKVPAAIHVTPEALQGGPLAWVQEGDIIRLDVLAGTLEIRVPAQELMQRPRATVDLSQQQLGMGRELFGALRQSVTGAEQGAMSFGSALWYQEAGEHAPGEHAPGEQVQGAQREHPDGAHKKEASVRASYSRAGGGTSAPGGEQYSV